MFRLIIPWRMACTILFIPLGSAFIIFPACHVKTHTF